MTLMITAVLEDDDSSDILSIEMLNFFISWVHTFVDEFSVPVPEVRVRSPERRSAARTRPPTEEEEEESRLFLEQWRRTVELYPLPRFSESARVISVRYNSPFEIQLSVSETTMVLSAVGGSAGSALAIVKFWERFTQAKVAHYEGKVSIARAEIQKLALDILREELGEELMLKDKYRAERFLRLIPNVDVQISQITDPAVGEEDGDSPQT